MPWGLDSPAYLLESRPEQMKAILVSSATIPSSWKLILSRKTLEIRRELAATYDPMPVFGFQYVSLSWATQHSNSCVNSWVALFIYVLWCPSMATCLGGGSFILMSMQASRKLGFHNLCSAYWHEACKTASSHRKVCLISLPQPLPSPWFSDHFPRLTPSRINCEQIQHIEIQI